MFRPGSGKGADQGKIRLPRQSAAPGIRELQALYEQAMANRGREVEMVWQVPGTYKTYTILIKFDRVTPQPLWQVWEDNGRETKMVWRFETADINMIYDVIAMLEVTHQKTTGTVQTLNQPTQGSTTSGTFPASNPRATGSFQSMAQSSQSLNRGIVGAGGAVNSGTFSTGGGQPYGQQSSASWKAVEQSQGGAADSGWKASESQSHLSNSGSHGNASSIQQAMANLAAGNALPNTPPLPTTQSLLKANQSQPAQMSPQQALAAQQGQNHTYMPEGSLPADFFSDAPATIAGAVPTRQNSIEGSIEQTPLNNVLTTIAMQQLTGKLEIAGESSVGHVYFETGMPKDAQTSTNRGDSAIKELVTWKRGTYAFKNGLRTEMSSVEKSLQSILLEGVALLEQLNHLERSGLVYESVLAQKQKNLGEPELKLMLAKGHPMDFNLQKEVYESLKHKMTFTDLLRDRPMDQTQWAPLLFNLLYCGLIEIKAPAATRGGALDFLGDGKQIIQNLGYHFIRPDTGIISFEALLYFMEYEFYRYEAYNWPMSLIAFEMSFRRPGASDAEPLPAQALATACMRIGLVKRPLDLLTHFQVSEYAILMPNTKASQAAFVANRILDALTVTPLAPGIDRASLQINFGVANLPSDGEDLESLLQATEQARLEARDGNFPIVLARTGKKD